jgi:hypothetical protein
MQTAAKWRRLLLKHMEVADFHQVRALISTKVAALIASINEVEN